MPLTILLAGVYVYVSTFQPGNFTGWASEGVKKEKRVSPALEKETELASPRLSLHARHTGDRETLTRGFWGVG